ncbi:hypothetical protein GoPhGRU1p82 [Gordonia phage GRU1]|uniref:Uncharacterized protein n=1 Tax=Gordonia phage GRU1 TaxID=1109710 RepID=G8EK41_9CAUD|nr:hypothetical protein GoPhGRU1p82 [Gordonia phage GRU1]AET09923.1 hypothetical protein [Gordonia phage GRU1]
MYMNGKIYLCGFIYLCRCAYVGIYLGYGVGVPYRGIYAYHINIYISINIFIINVERINY